MFAETWGHKYQSKRITEYYSEGDTEMEKEINEKAKGEKVVKIIL